MLMHEITCAQSLWGGAWFLNILVKALQALNLIEQMFLIYTFFSVSIWKCHGNKVYLIIINVWNTTVNRFSKQALKRDHNATDNVMPHNNIKKCTSMQKSPINPGESHRCLRKYHSIQRWQNRGRDASQKQITFRLVNYHNRAQLMLLTNEPPRGNKHWRAAPMTVGFPNAAPQ